MNPYRSTSGSQAGFTLAEMLVALAVTAVLLLGVLFTFDFNSRVARAQSNVADLQQSLRVGQDDMVRLVRMAGRGSLPLAVPGQTPLPQGLALGVRDKVQNNQFMLAGDEATRILPDTDVLTVRGVFGPLYQVNTTGAAAFDNPNNPTSGTLTILDVAPGGATQDLGPIKAAIDAFIKAGKPEAILLAAALDDSIHAVVELSGGSIADHQVVIAFRISGGPRSTEYLNLSTGGAFQKAVQNVAFAGILEERRYYVREEHAIAGDRSSDLTPKLSKALFYPGTTQVYKGDPGNARLDVADNIVDLQVALGFDTAVGGTGTPLLETANGANDDWLFNGSTDDANAPVWQGPPSPALQYVRVTTLARTDRRDPNYQAPLLPSPENPMPVLGGGRLENRTYAASDPLNSYESRMYRFQTLRTVVDLRNL